MTPEEIGIGLICEEAGPEFWQRVREEESWHWCRKDIEAVAGDLGPAERAELLGRAIYAVLRRYALASPPIEVTILATGQSFVRHGPLWKQGDRRLAAKLSAARSHLRYGK